MVQDPVNIVDLARESVVRDLLSINTVAKAWPVWKEQITKVVGPEPTVESLLGVDQSLSLIFQSTGTEGRAQAALSAGGVAWESLVAWVLNVWLIGSCAVVYKKRRDVPKPIQQALTVTYGTVNANTEADLVAVSFPSDEPLLYVPLSARETPFARLDEITKKRFGDISVAVIQTKTNWNDNAQVPMLWDLLYHAKGFDINVNVGTGQWDIKRLRSFKYAFVVVPSNNKAPYNPESTCVVRIAKLSGGNYWGRPTKNGVAASLREIFKRTRIGPHDGTAIRESLAKALPQMMSKYSYFDL